jgi:hypothetical protein
MAELKNTYLNLTPHPIVLQSETGERVSIPSSGVLRLASRAQISYESIWLKGGDSKNIIPVLTAQEFIGLDETSPGFSLFSKVKERGKVAGIIVSMPVGQFLGRGGGSGSIPIYSPSTSPENAVRDAEGKIVAVRALEIHNPNWN